MAGPSVAVRIIGDMSGLGKAFQDAGSTAATAGAKIKDAIGGALSTLNQTGILGPFGAAIQGGMDALDKLAEKGKDTGAKLAAAGGVMAGVGIGLQGIASKEQASHQQLQQAITNTGKDYDDYGDQIETAIKHQENFGNTAEDTQNALQILTQATNDPAKALQYLGTASDLAAAKHESLDTAATQLGKTYNGSSKLLKEFGSTQEKAVDTTDKVAAATNAAQKADEDADNAKQHLTDVQDSLKGKTTLTAAEQIKLRDAQQKVVDANAKQVDAHKKLTDTQTTVISKTQATGDNMDILAGKLKGQASAAADTFGGKMDAMKAKIEDSATAFAAKYGPAITTAGTAMAGLGAAWEVASGIKDALTTATEAGTVADEAAEVAELGSLGPILLVVAGVAALIAIGYELITHWSEVWGTAKAIVMDVWNWIKANWPLLLAIITGPIGLAVLEIVRHWQDIKDGATSVWQWIKDKFNDLVGFFTGLPGRLAGAWTGIWDGLKGAAKAAFNAVAGLWNNTIGSLSFSVPSWVPGLGGKGFSMPHIPPAMAEGGIVTRPTLALVGEAGPEAVIPLNKAGMGRSAPVVHIENATFNTATDIDLIAKKLEFAVSAGLRV